MLSIRSFFCLLTLVLSLCLSPIGVNDVSGQGSGILESAGLQFHLHRDASGSGGQVPDYAFGFYTRHSWSPSLFGELAVSVGTISGVDFKSRRIPAEYRLNLSLSGSRRFEADEVFVAPFLFAGIGWMFHTPLELPADNDPLTQQAGRTVGVSPLWQFESSITPYLPVGIGIERALGENAALDVRLSYQHPLDISSLSSGPSFSPGFWGLTVGMRFGRILRRDRAPEPAPVPPPVRPVIQPVEPQPVEPVTPRFPYAEVNSLRIHFDLLKTDISDRDRMHIEWLSSRLHEHQEITLEIRGHTDSTGPDHLNELLSDSRARSVWLRLVDLGIDPSRLAYRGFRDLEPIVSEESERDRRMNRRVEFRLTESLPAIERVTVRERSDRLIDYQISRPLFGRQDLSFRWFSAEPVLGTMQRLEEIRDLLLAHTDIGLLIVAEDNSFFYEAYRREVSRARAEWIRSWLIRQGVEPQRVEAYGADKLNTLPASIRSYLRTDGTQQILLVPTIYSGDRK